MAFINSYSEFVKYHTDRGHDMVQDVFEVMVDDQLAIWNSSRGMQEKFIVTEKMYLSGLLELLPVGKKDVIVVNPKEHTIFKFPFSPKAGYGPKCQCGARHTSFPNIHLFYCPLRRD